MARISKNFKKALAAYDQTKGYSLNDAIDIVKKITFTKFNASVDIAVKLGVDPKQANQMVRGVATLPHGTGKDVKVLVLTTADKEAEAKEAGAEFVGLDEYITKIESGWTDIDVIICSPDVMAKVGRLGRVLGPRGLMPNPKSGTVTNEVGKAVKEVKAGKIDFKVDRTGIIHTTIGKVNFTTTQLSENAAELISVLQRLKPATTKDTYFKSIFVSSTMSPSVNVEKSTIKGI